MSSSLKAYRDFCTILSCSEEVKLWKLGLKDNTKTLVSQFQPLESAVTAVAWSTNNQIVATASAGGQLHLSLSSGKLLSDFSKERKANTSINSLSFSSNSRYLCSAGQSKHLELWDLQKKALVRTLEGHKSEVKCVAFGRADMLLASGATDGKILLHNTHHNTISHLNFSTFRRTPQAITSLRFSTLKKALVGGTSDSGHVRIWDSNTAKSLISFKKHTAPATGMAFSKKHRSLICSASLDQTLRFFDISKGNEIKVAQTPEPVTCIDFLEDGQTIAVGTILGKVILYDLRKVSQGQGHSFMFQAHGREVVDLQFGCSSNSSNIIISSSIGSIGSSNTNTNIASSKGKKGGNKSITTNTTTTARLLHKKKKGSTASSGTSLSTAGATTTTSSSSTLGKKLDISIDANSSILAAEDISEGGGFTYHHHHHPHGGRMINNNDSFSSPQMRIDRKNKHRSADLSMDITSSSPSSIKDHLPSSFANNIDTSFDTTALTPRTNASFQDMHFIRNSSATTRMGTASGGENNFAAIASKHPSTVLDHRSTGSSSSASISDNYKGDHRYNHHHHHQNHQEDTTTSAWGANLLVSSTVSSSSLKRPSSSHSHKSQKSRFGSSMVPVAEEPGEEEEGEEEDKQQQQQRRHQESQQHKPITPTRAPPPTTATTTTTTTTTTAITLGDNQTSGALASKDETKYPAIPLPKYNNDSAASKNHRISHHRNSSGSNIGTRNSSSGSSRSTSSNRNNSSSRGSSNVPSKGGGGGGGGGGVHGSGVIMQSMRKRLDANDLHKQLIKSTVEEMVGQMKEELQEEISRVHLGMIRQFHLQQEMYQKTIGVLTHEIKHLKDEIKALRDF